MRTERLLRVSYATRDARQALKQLVPSMASGFNVNAVHGNCSVNGADAKDSLGNNVTSVSNAVTLAGCKQSRRLRNVGS